MPIFSVSFWSAGSPHVSCRNLRRLLRRSLILILLLAPLLPVAPLFAQASAPSSDVGEKIVEIRVIGSRRIPKETILARMFSHVNDSYDPLTVERDFNSLWNTGYFEDVRIEKEDTPQGVILDVYVREKPVIRDITYKGNNSITESDILDRFKKEKVGLSQESQYDPARIAHAVTVIKEMLAEHGHQFATVRPEVKTIPPASVQIVFQIKEGPTVKVGKISFSGNRRVSSRVLRESMRNLRPIGIPHSIFLENLFARTYDASKLDEDTERVRQAYRDRGYLRGGPVGSPTTKIRNESGLSLFTFRPRRGKRIDIHMNIEEGERYRLAAIKFTGYKPGTNVKALRAIFSQKDGTIFNLTTFQKDLQNLQKAYSQNGYINFSPLPVPTFDDAKHTVTWNIDIDEGKQFTVSRIEFQGNTVTRDFVIRRELLLQEGQVYNSHLWELSLLRLNQLDYFNPLRVDQDSETHQNTENATVDLLLKVQEKGKNSIGLNGGVSGLSGAFLGLNYQTNNFLGLGETLSVQANAGSLARNLLFAFNEPYFRNKPLNIGFQVFDRKTDYNASKSYSLSGTATGNQNSAISSLLQNYNQGEKGFNLSVSYPIRHFSLFGFSRVGATYAWDSSSVRAFSQASSNLFQTLAFRSGIQGQNALEGIITSSAMFSYNSSNISSNYLPHTGQSLAATVQFAGIWGSVRYVRPVVEYKRYQPMKGLWFNPAGRNTLGMRLQAIYITGFSGDVAPPFDRPSAGGEADIRGFDVRTVTPYGFVPTRVLFDLTNPDGSTVPRDPTNPSLGPIQVPLPVYGIATIGGDTNFTANLQYMIPIYGHTVGFNFFNDFGMDMALRNSQLRQSPEGIDALDSPLYGCPNYINGTCQGGQQITFSKTIDPIPGTNYVPRDSAGGELDVMMPIINAPFRIYYAVNPLKLFTVFSRQNLITRSMFPAGGAGDYSYAEAEQLYNGLYVLREPSKTFRLTVATTF
ncbi:MAG TPA: outer membrane protein assembly factor BamA [Acidobacteriaceae bacterium]|nr:outer membrane protein assembly factor BamA [Acidobacteriaceae bacterium]